MEDGEGALSHVNKVICLQKLRKPFPMFLRKHPHALIPPDYIGRWLVSSIVMITEKFVTIVLDFQGKTVGISESICGADDKDDPLLLGPVRRERDV